MTGAHVAALLRNAGYSLEDQLEALLFMYHQVVPRLGNSPTSGNLSSEKGENGPLSLDGTQIEYSWRWNYSDTKPEIGMVVEPFSRLAGRGGSYANFPNLQPATDTLYSMMRKCPSLDMDLFNHLINKLYSEAQNNELHAEDYSFQMKVYLGFEFKGHSVFPKAYFFPRKLRHISPASMGVLGDAIATAGFRSTTISSVFSFVKEEAPMLGLTLAPLWLGIDVVNAADARIKLYCVEKRTSFQSVSSILTMNGRMSIDANLLDKAWVLMRAACGLPVGFSRDHDLPQAPTHDLSMENDANSSLWNSFIYYFDIGMRREDVPLVKLYIPTCQYGGNDDAIAYAITTWMQENGRGQYVDAYWDTLREIVQHRELRESRGAHMWLSMMFQEGKLQVTTYISPEIHHPNRHQDSTE